MIPGMTGNEAPCFGRPRAEGGKRKAVAPRRQGALDHPRGANDHHAKVLAVAVDAALSALGDAASVHLEPSPEEKRALAALGFRYLDDNVV
jgi:hypothetical protein